jgi:hypothetical protein
VEIAEVLDESKGVRESSKVKSKSSRMSLLGAEEKTGSSEAVELKRASSWLWVKSCSSIDGRKGSMAESLKGVLD